MKNRNPKQSSAARMMVMGLVLRRERAERILVVGLVEAGLQRAAESVSSQSHRAQVGEESRETVGRLKEKHARKLRLCYFKSAQASRRAEVSAETARQAEHQRKSEGIRVEQLEDIPVGSRKGSPWQVGWAVLRCAGYCLRIRALGSEIGRGCGFSSAPACPCRARASIQPSLHIFPSRPAPAMRPDT